MADEKKDDQEKKKKLKQGETEDITKKATDENKDFKTSGVEGTKDSSPQPPPPDPGRGQAEGDNKAETQNTTPNVLIGDPNPVVSKVEPSEIVRGEDVIKILRAKGVKI